MGAKRVSKDTQFWRVIKAPIRVLARARDLYIQSLTGGHVSYGNTMGCPTPQIPSLPRSDSNLSSKSGDEELRDILRLTSTRKYSGKVLRRTQSELPIGAAGGAGAPVARSNTIGCGRIDEDKPLMSFGEDEEAGFDRKVFPVRSYGVTGGITVA